MPETVPKEIEQFRLQMANMTRYLDDLPRFSQPDTMLAAVGQLQQFRPPTAKGKRPPAKKEPQRSTRLRQGGPPLRAAPKLASQPPAPPQNFGPKIRGPSEISAAKEAARVLNFSLTSSLHLQKLT